MSRHPKKARIPYRSHQSRQCRVDQRAGECAASAPSVLEDALTRSMQKPSSTLWKGTRSTRPAKTSVELALGASGIRV